MFSSARLVKKSRLLGFRTAVVLITSGGAAFPAQAEIIQVPAIPGVLPDNARIEVVKEDFKGTEGPIAAPDGGLLFTENQAGRILKISPQGEVSVFTEQSNGSNALAYKANGDLVSVQTQQPRVGIIEPAAHARTLVDRFEERPFGRPNDLVIDARGGVYFTDSGINANQPSPKSDIKPAAPAVYYLTAAGELRRLVHDIERPNGIQLSPDGKRLYVADTAGAHLLAFDVAADGSVSRRRQFAGLAGYRQADDGKWGSGADGLAIDADGRLYAATNAGVEIFSADGEALGIIRLPKKPQNLAFSGIDKKTLYIVGRGSVYRVATLASGYRGRVK